MSVPNSLHVPCVDIQGDRMRHALSHETIFATLCGIQAGREPHVQSKWDAFTWYNVSGGGIPECPACYQLVYGIPLAQTEDDTP